MARCGAAWQLLFAACLDDMDFQNWFWDISKLPSFSRALARDQQWQSKKRNPQSPERRAACAKVGFPGPSFGHLAS